MNYNSSVEVEQLQNRQMIATFIWISYNPVAYRSRPHSCAAFEWTGGIKVSTEVGTTLRNV